MKQNNHSRYPSRVIQLKCLRGRPLGFCALDQSTPFGRSIALKAVAKGFCCPRHGGRLELLAYYYFGELELHKAAMSARKSCCFFHLSVPPQLMEKKKRNKTTFAVLLLARRVHMISCANTLHALSTLFNPKLETTNIVYAVYVPHGLLLMHQQPIGRMRVKTRPSVTNVTEENIFLWQA